MDEMRIALSGIGNRALPKRPETSNWLGWVGLIAATDGCRLVAAHDPSDESRGRIVERGRLGPAEVFGDLGVMLDRVRCDALLVANPAESHAASVRMALERDLHVLVEKPFVADPGDGAELVELARRHGRVVAVVQNWRTKDAGLRLRRAVTEGTLGRVGHVFFRYVRDRENPGYPAYIFDEPYPLLYAMGIHHLDLFRWVLGDEIASVAGSSFRPAWSLYRSDTGVSLSLVTRGGATIAYTGTVSSKQRMLPQESLLIEGEEGSLLCESDWLEPPLLLIPKGSREPVDLTADVDDRSVAGQYDCSDRNILEDFLRAVTTGRTPICSAEDGLRSVLAVDAARRACETGERVRLADGAHR